MSTQHTSDRQPDAGLSINLHIGQHVRHRDFKGERVTGVVHGLTLDTERGLMADIVLDRPIVVPARGEWSETRIHRQYVPAHEVAAFDDRDELIAELFAALQALRQICADCDVEVSTTPPAEEQYAAAMDAADAAIAKATGSAS